MRTGPASTPASGPPARRSAWRSDRAIYALVLALGSYKSSTDLDDFTTSVGFQPDSALTAIVLGFSLLPAVLIVASLFFLSRYRLDAETVRQIEGVTA